MKYKGTVCIGYTVSGKQVHFERLSDPCAPFYLHDDAPVCLHAYASVRVWGGLFVFECDSVYSVGPGTLRLSVPSGESAHMCLHEDLVPCGCVFDKLWEHVGDCLSIHLGERDRESRMRRWKKSASKPLSSSQSAHSHTNLFISSWDRREGDR